MSGQERNLSDRVRATLSAVGARLKRDTKHLVYELPNGNKVTVATTPSDKRADLNQVRDIHKAAGVEREAKPPRVARAPKPGRFDPNPYQLPQSVSPLARALRDTGVVEQQLRSQVGQLQRELDLSVRLVQNLEARLAESDRIVQVQALRLAELRALWVVRAWRRWSHVSGRFVRWWRLTTTRVVPAVMRRS